MPGLKASPTPGMRATAYATTAKARDKRAFLFLMDAYVKAAHRSVTELRTHWDFSPDLSP
jgi:hypothetical protein